jgi:hypothetical protein
VLTPRASSCPVHIVIRHVQLPFALIVTAVTSTQKEIVVYQLCSSVHYLLSMKLARRHGKQSLYGTR